jgi:hypothetical protein
MPGMAGWDTFLRSEAGGASLESSVRRAGMALACPFSGSADFEAAVIRAKRDAGVYGPKRRRRQLLRAMLPALVIAAAVVAAISRMY